MDSNSTLLHCRVYFNPTSKDALFLSWSASTVMVTCLELVTTLSNLLTSKTTIWRFRNNRGHFSTHRLGISDFFICRDIVAI